MRTREEKNAYAKAYYNANREAVKEKRAQYYKDNKEAFQERARSFKSNAVEDFHTLYYLPEHHYAGVTNQPKLRMLNHRAAGKVTTGWEVVATFKAKREALDAEYELHKIGYYGKHINK